jgi:site-specific DNA recombinase
MLSGLGKCGVCGGSYIRVDRGYWACNRNKDGRRCGNTRTISTASYESRVLAHLQDDLLDPELVAAYVREYHRDYARRVGDTSRERQILTRKIGEATRKVERLVAAISSGAGEFAEIRDALAAAREERDRCSADLNRVEALPLMVLHPNLAEDYKREVAVLGAALSQNDAAKLEAIPRLRALIDTITITPTASLRGVTVEVTGRLDMLLRLAMTIEADETGKYASVR